MPSDDFKGTRYDTVSGISSSPSGLMSSFECAVPPLDIRVCTIHLSPYRAGVAGPCPTRLLTSPAFPSGSCSLSFSESGKTGRLEVCCLGLRSPLGTILSVRTTAHTFASSGSPVPWAQEVQALCLSHTRPPACQGSLLPVALSLAFPSSDSSGSSVTLGLAPRRPARRALLPHVRACGRRSTPALPARMGRCWTRRGRTSRPLAWATRPSGAATLAPEALHGPPGIGLQAIQRSPGHAGLAAPQFPRLLSVLGFLGRLLFPPPVGSR
jgi:hypothetical protein